jgi:hypothetical protein
MADFEIFRKKNNSSRDKIYERAGYTWTTTKQI